MMTAFLGMFVNAALWPFLALAAVPVLLHLLSLRRLRIIELSTYRFLFDTYVQQRRRMKLHELLLAILRFAFVLLMVALAMRPVTGKWSNLLGSGGKPVVLVVDCSASMALTTAGVSSLDRAKEAARTILGRLSPSDRVTLVKLDGRAEIVASQFAANAPELASAVDGLKTGHGEGNAYAGLSLAFGGDRVTARAVYLVTDAQKSNWSELAKQQETRFANSDDRLVILNVGSPGRPANVAVLGRAPADVDPVVGQPLELRPRIANYSDETASVTLRVEVDGREIATLPLSIPPGKVTERRIAYVPTEPGVRKGRFSVAHDRFEADDEFKFCVNVAAPVRVVLVNGRPNGDPFQDELVFLETALGTRDVEDAPTAAKADKPSLKTLGAASLAVEKVNDGAWNADRIAGAGVVVLANAQQVGGERAKDLRRFVDLGGGLLVFPGDQVNAQTNRELLTPEGVNMPPLVGVQFENAIGDPNNRTQFDRFAAIDYRHPVLTVFDPSDGAAHLSGPRFHRWHPLRLQRNAGASAMAQFGNGDPALVEGKFGRGRAIVAAFPVNSQWSTLPLHPDFVPLSLRLVSYVRRRSPLLVPSAVKPNDPVLVTAADRLEDPQLTITPPDGIATPLAVAAGGTETAVRYEGTQSPGYYLLDLVAQEPAVRGENSNEPAKPGRNLHAVAGFAVNMDPRESDFTGATADELKSWTGERTEVVDLSQAVDSVEEELTTKQEIWRLLAWAMAAVFVVEFFVATLRPARTAAEKAKDAEAGSLVTRLTGVKPMDE